ncbi:hypothetical protein ACIQPR_21375 [Streptomyces sp. NPDC091280]|uniref:hypothetical protein n=1 Tax=Streptomyces sp. NPDC091280 TaxID=3365984 RepID=UPI00381EAD0C
MASTLRSVPIVQGRGEAGSRTPFVHAPGAYARRRRGMLVLRVYVCPPRSTGGTAPGTVGSMVVCEAAIQGQAYGVEADRLEPQKG